MEAHMQLGNYLVAYLRKIGLTHLFGIPGDLVIQLFMKFGQPHDIQEPDDDERAEGLTMMRIVMQKETQARIVLGGKVDGYKGRMPGIAEEALLSLQSHQPIFLLGGFGGCTRDIAETIGLADPWAGSRSHWDGRPLRRVTRRVICTMDYLTKITPFSLGRRISIRR